MSVMSESSMITVTFISGPRKGETLRFGKSVITFGREESCDVSFRGESYSTVSARHAALEFKSGSWVLTDTSTNGTYVGDKKLLRKSYVTLKSGDTFRFSRNGDLLRVSMEGDVPREDGFMTNPGITKIIPIARMDFITNLKSQPFFIIGIITAISGVLLFSLLNAAAESPSGTATGYIYAYELLLGLYIGALILFAITRISKTRMPAWFIAWPAATTAVMLFFFSPLLVNTSHSSLFSPLLSEYNRSFILSLAGHFLGVGLPEELFKSIPVWIGVIFAPAFEKRKISGFGGGRLHQKAAVFIGASSAIGFIIVETLFVYVPGIQRHGDIAAGLMLLIPRFITGISGHVAWSGTFAYFIGLAQNIKAGKLKYVAGAWLAAGLLHGLWNAASITGSPLLLGGIVAVISFIAFSAYLYKAQD